MSFRFERVYVRESVDGIVDVIAQTKFFSKIVQRGGIYENKTRGGEEEGLRVNVFREETIFRSQTEVYYIYISRHIVTSAGLIFFRYEASIYTLCLSSVASSPWLHPAKSRYQLCLRTGREGKTRDTRILKFLF